VRNPQVFLFDEPLSNLDAKLRVQTRMELQKLHREFKTTSLYVTHDQVEAMTLGERLIVMNAGVAEQIGAPMQVYARPASTFVAGFIGSPGMNLIRGEVSGTQFKGDQGMSITLPARAPRDGALILGIRPEHLHLASESQAAFSYTVEMVETLGADSYAYGSGGGTTLIARLGGASAALGNLLPVGFEAANLHWFDAASGKRVE